MSDFLEDVFAAQAARQAPRRRRRRASTGFTGRRYAVLVTLMASLTAVPTWIMLRAGVEGLDQPVAATVAPLLPQEPPASSKQPDPAVTDEPWVAPVMPPDLAPPPAAPPRSEPPAPVLERRSVVDTDSRPVRKKATKPPAKATKPTTKATTKPSPPPEPEPVKASTGPDPAAVVSGMPTPPEPVKPPRLAERPSVQPPSVQRPSVQRPSLERPEPPRVEKPDLSYWESYWESAWRARS